MAGQRRRATRRMAVLPAAGLIAALALGACSGSGDDAAEGDSAAQNPQAIEAALQKGGEITFWTWLPEVQKSVDEFQKAYPKVKVKVVNAGQSADQYTKLQNAIKAGSGAPDVAQIEYFALPQFAISKSLVDLSSWGLDSLKESYSESAWNQVTVAGKPYGFPQDTGPMVMMYREDILNGAGVKPPATWDEFAQAAQKLKAKNPNTFITAIDPGDAGGVDSLIWQSGATPFALEGDTQVKVNLDDPNAVKTANLWTGLIKKGLVQPTPGWTDEWWKSMASGQYPIWLTGAWAPGTVASTIPQTAGKWRVAPMPQWDASSPKNAENGGSSNAVLKQSKNPALALGFARWLNASPEGAKALNTNSGTFPATKALLESSEWTQTPIPFLGGQQANAVMAESATQVAPGWQYLPFQVYANSVFGDTVGKSISEKGDISGGLKAWQDQIATYGKQQGFEVSAGS